jgi:predicted nuclease of restriction endonuclease-like (RecB) superfamily
MTLYKQIHSLILEAERQTIKEVNNLMVNTYFQIGKYIVEDEQKGKEKAEYAQETLKTVSKLLTEEFGKGFSERNLRNMRALYLSYHAIWQTASAKSLSWSHYLFLLGIDNPMERTFYEIEAGKNHWSLRELKRQFNTALYERLALSTDKEGILALSKHGQILQSPKDTIKDPYILEFLGLDEKTRYTETELEQAIIDNIENFILELGNGFLFVGRQKRISFEDKHFYIDLVFYHRFLRCFVLIDLKIGDLQHQDLGQMQMYVNYYDRQIRQVEENQTIGIILCKRKTQSVVEFTLPENNQQIFASKYSLYLPNKEQLQKQLEKIDL